MVLELVSKGPGPAADKDAANGSGTFLIGRGSPVVTNPGDVLCTPEANGSRPPRGPARAPRGDASLLPPVAGFSLVTVVTVVLLLVVGGQTAVL